MQAAHPADVSAGLTDAVTAPAAARPAASTPLGYLPVGLFGAVMGLTGLAVAWRLAHQSFGAPAVVGQAIGLLALLTFLVLAVAYGIKAAAGVGVTAVRHRVVALRDRSCALVHPAELCRTHLDPRLVSGDPNRRRRRTDTTPQRRPALRQTNAPLS